MLRTSTILLDGAESTGFQGTVDATAGKPTINTTPHEQLLAQETRIPWIYCSGTYSGIPRML
jgi:hypothetical protein